VYSDVAELVSFAITVFGYWCYVNTLMLKCNLLSIMNLDYLSKMVPSYVLNYVTGSTF
jgi:hypothetical protein